MAEKAKAHPQAESGAEAQAPERPQYAPHQDDSGFDYSPSTNPMGVGRGAATPFRQPAAYRGEGGAFDNNATLVGDYSRRQPPSAEPVNPETAAQTPPVSGTGVAAGPSGPGSATPGAAGTTAVPAPSAAPAHGQAGTAANP